MPEISPVLILKAASTDRQTSRLHIFKIFCIYLVSDNTLIILVYSDQMTSEARTHKQCAWAACDVAKWIDCWRKQLRSHYTARTIKIEYLLVEHVVFCMLVPFRRDIVKRTNHFFIQAPEVFFFFLTWNMDKLSVDYFLQIYASDAI